MNSTENENIINIPPAAVCLLLTDETKVKIIEGVKAHLNVYDQQPGAYFMATENIPLLSVPFELIDNKVFRAVIVANHYGYKFNIIGFFVYSPETVTDKQALQYVHGLSIPVHASKN